jgi:diacylglycerol kinase (ATP)
MPASSQHTQNAAKPLDLLFIINPGSGGNTIDWSKEINSFFTGSHHAIELFELPASCDPSIIRKKIQESKASRVIAVGGDGTVKLIAEFLVHSEKVLGILPAGSANGLAKELGISIDPMEALQQCLSAQVKKIHLVKINDELCIHLSDIGFNAFVVKTFETQKGRGMWGYIKAAWKVLWRHPHMDIKIQSADEHIERKAAMVVIANATRYGSGAVINPLGRLDDDLFEVVIVKKVSFSEIFKMMVTHRPFDENKTEVFQSRSVDIRSRRKAHFQVDGEYLGKLDKINATVLPQALNVVAPEIESGN